MATALGVGIWAVHRVKRDMNAIAARRVQENPGLKIVVLV